MAQALASLDDVQTFLPEDKLDVDDPDIDLIQEDVRRVVKGYLSGVVDPTDLAAWTSPNTTPDLIRAIAGRLCAAKYYKIRYSEDSVEIPPYAQDLYNEAMDMMQKIIAGDILIGGVTVTAGAFTNQDFYPNDASQPPAWFTMDKVF